MIDMFAIRILDIQKGRNERNAMKYKSVRFDIKCFSKMISKYHENDLISFQTLPVLDTIIPSLYQNINSNGLLGF